MVEKFGEWSPDSLMPFAGLTRVLEEMGFDQSQRMYKKLSVRGNSTRRVMGLENSATFTNGTWILTAI